MLHPHVKHPMCGSSTQILRSEFASDGLRHDPAVILEALVRVTKGYARDPWTNFWTHEALGIMAMPMAMSMAMSGTLWKTNITMENHHF